MGSKITLSSMISLKSDSLQLRRLKVFLTILAKLKSFKRLWSQKMNIVLMKIVKCIDLMKRGSSSAKGLRILKWNG